MANAAKVAGSAWTVVKHRKAIVAGAAFAIGRSTARPRTDPLTRLTGGRI
ncbi:hypothetical protein [Streptomyces sp. LaPpAH-108]|nr:hypothetical protein [Streptomyces sp. LaPpAH-108]